jgi:hypothetical protein
MVSVTLDAVVVNEPHFDQTRGGVNRASFVVESPCPDSLPLRFAVTCLGTGADRASAFQLGTRLLLFGRMLNGSKEKKVYVLASVCEVLAQPASVAPEGWQTGENQS